MAKQTVEEPQRNYFLGHKIVRQKIKEKFWRDLENDIPHYKKDRELEDLIQYYRGYANGLYECGVNSIEEHHEVIARLAQKLIWIQHQRFLKQVK